MREAKIQLEAVTPLLIGGADPNGPPQARAPSFRGLWRYWLRAAAGAVIGDKNKKALKSIEEAVLGSPDRGSPLTLRIPQKEFRLSTGKVPILPHAEGRGVRRPAINAGETFELYITCLQVDTQPARLIWQAGLKSLQLALALGGIGLRSRRGYGTVHVCDVNGTEELTVFPETYQGWETFITDITQQTIAAFDLLAQHLGLNRPGLSDGPSPYPCANRRGMLFLGDEVHESAMDAVIAFMDHVSQADWLGGIDPRQASPLWLRPVKVENGYRLLMSVLASDFEKCDYGKVEDFIRDFGANFIHVEGWNQ